jgi:hypothetical protein
MEFEIKAANDAHIALVNNNDFSDDKLYEIVIGKQNNQM